MGVPSIITKKHRQELEVKGYTVVKDAVPRHKVYQKEIFHWMTESFGDGNAPYAINSLVRGYNIGHVATVWQVRLDAKDLFAQLWGEDQLLTSLDAVALGQPPEMGAEEFDCPELHWLHVDQCAARKGLHSYQGAVYLETADEDDWTFEVMEGSHRLLEKFYEEHKHKGLKSVFRGMHRMNHEEDLAWFTNQGCEIKRIPVKAGGLLLWDSRLIHANARPIKGRHHPDRWRMVVLVCMAPASWATDQDLKIKAKAYKEMKMTTHWPCDDVTVMESRIPSFAPKSRLQPATSHSLPARSAEALQLAGVVPYPRRKSSLNSEGHPRPTWDFQLRPDMARRIKGDATPLMKIVILGILVILSILASLFICWSCFS